MYTTNGRFIFTEHFTPPQISSSSYKDNYQYHANGQLKAVTRVNTEGDYEIWTGYNQNKQSGLKIDKDGVTTVNKLCIGDSCLTEDKIIKLNNLSGNLCLDDICLTKKDILLNKVVNSVFITDELLDGILKKYNIEKDIEELTSTEIALIIEELKTSFYESQEEATLGDTESDEIGISS